MRRETHHLRWRTSVPHRKEKKVTSSWTFTAFANVSLGNLDIFLSGPGASGSRRMPDGNQQEPGGWNRVVFRVPDLEAAIETLKDADIHLRNDMEVGPAGKQIQFEAPDGNPIELFEPARKSS